MTRMSLEKLVQLDWYKAEPSSPKEIADLFSIVDRSQADLKVESISDDLRFQATYNGILTLANIALRASGFRVSLGQGHHQRVIESLEHTLTTQDAVVREKWVRKIKSHSQKRKSTSYDLTAKPGWAAPISGRKHRLHIRLSPKFRPEVPSRSSPPLASVAGV